MANNIDLSDLSQKLSSIITDNSEVNIKTYIDLVNYKISDDEKIKSAFKITKKICIIIYDDKIENIPMNDSDLGPNADLINKYVEIIFYGGYLYAKTQKGYEKISKIYNNAADKFEPIEPTTGGKLNKSRKLRKSKKTSVMLKRNKRTTKKSNKYLKNKK
jgi:hypothetical protein